MSRDGACPRAALLLCAFLVHSVLVCAEDASAAAPEPVAQMTLTMTDGQGKQSPVVATVLPEEDAAAAAVRFCFDKGLLQPSQVLDIVRYLKGALEGKEHEPDIEYLRTAGAYSRRAAESAKEENYSEAAAGRPPVDALADSCCLCVGVHALLLHLHGALTCHCSLEARSSMRVSVSEVPVPVSVSVPVSMPVPVSMCLRLCACLHLFLCLCVCRRPGSGAGSPGPRPAGQGED
jgi:hypothetical protein